MAIDQAKLMLEVARIEAMPDPLTQRAEALLDTLGRLAPFDAASITLLDPHIERSRPLVRRGYPDRVQRYLDSAAFLGGMDLLTSRRSPRPIMRLRDVPVPLPELELWAEYLQPAGFGEGLGTPLFTAQGSVLGYVSTQSGDSAAASDETCDVLATLAPLIALAVDPMRTLTALSRVVADAVAGVVVTDAGDTVALPGLPDHPLLVPGSAVLSAAAAQLVQAVPHAAFLCPSTDDPAPLARVTALACPAPTYGGLRRIVLLSPPPDLHALTRRELEVLGRLIAGGSNAQIASALFISVRTVEDHIERILVKFNVSSRTAAGIRALRQGLYIPYLTSGRPTETLGTRVSRSVAR